jgi:hypothetical protein
VLPRATLIAFGDSLAPPQAAPLARLRFASATPSATLTASRPRLCRASRRLGLDYVGPLSPVLPRSLWLLRVPGLGYAGPGAEAFGFSAAPGLGKLRLTKRARAEASGLGKLRLTKRARAEACPWQAEGRRSSRGRVRGVRVDPKSFGFTFGLRVWPLLKAGWVGLKPEAFGGSSARQGRLASASLRFPRLGYAFGWPRRSLKVLRTLLTASRPRLCRAS